MIGLLTVIVVAAAALIVRSVLSGDDKPGAPVGDFRQTVPVVRETLVNEVSVKGRLDNGPDVPLAVPGSGTITGIAPEDGAVRRGYPLLLVDEAPVIVFYGDVPMFRVLKADVTGRDVEQLEENLRALGFRDFAVDGKFTDGTADAVKRWQGTVGRARTGVVQPGQIVFVPGPIRVTRHLLRPGTALSGADVLTYASLNKSVTVEASADQVDWAKAGRAVTVALPDGKKTKGKVDTVANGGAEAKPGEAAGAALRVQVELDDQKAVRGYDRSPVDVRYVSESRADVLTVPVAALLALAEGGYGLEVMDGAKTRIIPVEVGLFTDARVEVSGADLAEGMKVSVAS